MLRWTSLCTVLLMALVSSVRSAEPVKPAVRPATRPVESAYLLRYKFTPGQTLRWEVEHRAQVRMTVSGTTQTAETFSQSLKVWKVAQVDRDGQATFIHSVDRVNMRQEMNGRAPVTFNSETDPQAPLGFQDVAKAVGVPLSTVTLDPLGKIVKRVDSPIKHAASTQYITIPLPEEPVAIGATWSFADDLTVTLRDKQQKKIQRRQELTLEEVKNGIAVIRIETKVLTPVGNPAVEAQLVQGELNGRIRFDVERGRIDSQQLDLDRHVVGVQGEASSMHYVTRFTERFLPTEPQTAARPNVAGPPLPPK